jgi:hypothetical protein
MIILEAAYKRLEIQTGSNEVRIGYRMWVTPVSHDRSNGIIQKGKANLAAIQSQLSKLQEGSHNFFPVKKLSDKFTKKYDLDGLEGKVWTHCDIVMLLYVLATDYEMYIDR